jgi:hypothetical protein
MKRARILLVLTAVLLPAAWAMATIEIQTTTPRVNPDGMCEVAGTFRMIFTAPEFGDPNNAADPAYFVLVRVQLSQGVQLMNIGGRTKPQVTPATFIALALEKDSGNPSFPTDDPDAVRIVRFESGTAGDYFDILFTKNMYHASWSLSGSDRVRVTLGTPAGATPTDAVNNFGGAPGVGTQADTRLCCNFAATTQDFAFDDFWRVGMVAWNSNVNGVPGATYSVNFQPPDPALAQKGASDGVCRVVVPPALTAGTWKEGIRFRE